MQRRWANSHIVSAGWLLLAVEMAVIAWKLREQWVFGDGVVYLALADNFVTRGEWGQFWTDGSWFFEDVRPLGYPALLALARGAGASVGAIVALQAFALWWVLRQFSKEPGLALPSGLVVAFVINPAFLALNLRIHTEAVSTILMLVMIVLLARNRSPIAAGLILGISILVRPNFMILTPIAVWSWTRLSWRSTAIGSAATLLVLSPMLFFNLQHFGKPVFTAAHSTVPSSLYITTWEYQVPLSDFLANYETDQLSPAAQRLGLLEDVSLLNNQIGAPPHTKPWTLETYPPILRARAAELTLKWAIDRIWKNPGQWMSRYLETFFWIWNTREYPPAIPRLMRPVLIATTAALTLLGWVGAAFIVLRFYRERRMRSPDVNVYCALVVFLTALAQPIMHCESRYTIAARVPLYCCALFLISSLVRRIGERRNQGTPVAGV